MDVVLKVVLLFGSSSPIAGGSPAMCNGDNLNHFVTNPKHDNIREPLEKIATSAVQVRSHLFWRALDRTNRNIQLIHEPLGGGCTSLCIPLASFMSFNDCLWMELNRQKGPPFPP